MEPTLETVRKKIRIIFPDKKETDILACLENYGIESYEKGRYRIYLAILKLCEEKNIPDPTYYVKAAKQDFRDVLAWAEYPNQMKFGPTTDPVKTAELVKKDQKQYESWLNKT